MQTEVLHLPDSSCTFMHSDNAHKAETQAVVCPLTRAALSWSWSGATHWISLSYHSDLSWTWLEAVNTWETKSNSRADSQACQLLHNDCELLAAKKYPQNPKTQMKWIQMKRGY